jgi:hypothetical protein
MHLAEIIIKVTKVDSGLTIDHERDNKFTPKQYVVLGKIAK